MLRIGVLGAGHLGKIHIKLIKEIEQYELVGFYDPNPENAVFAESEFGIKSYADVDSLIDDVDVIDIVTPTLSHYDCAVQALRKSKHIFVEKPITNTLDEAKKLIKLADEASVKVQVGHVERFNPAVIEVQKIANRPGYIEADRISPFSFRSIDIGVVLDLLSFLR